MPGIIDQNPCNLHNILLDVRNNQPPNLDIGDKSPIHYDSKSMVHLWPEIVVDNNLDNIQVYHMFDISYNLLRSLNNIDHNVLYIDSKFVRSWYHIEIDNNRHRCFCIPNIAPLWEVDSISYISDSLEQVDRDRVSLTMNRGEHVWYQCRKQDDRLCIDEELIHRSTRSGDPCYL